MKINGLEKPIGYNYETLLLSWQVESGAICQVEAAVSVFCEVTLPRSGKESFLLTSGSYDFRYFPDRDYRAVYSMESRLSALAEDEEARKILLKDAPALFGVLKEGNREFTAQTFRELSNAFFLGMNPPPKVEALVARLSQLLR